MERIVDGLFAIYWPVSRVVSRLWYSNRNPISHRIPPGPAVTADDPIWNIIGIVQRYEEQPEVSEETVAHT